MQLPFKNFEGEQAKVLSLLRTHAGASPRILDVGCGYGRNLRVLVEEGFSVVGVEKNAQIVAENRKNKLPCLSPEELDASKEKFDVLLLSHIVEHFAPHDLLAFLDHYFPFLRDGGLVLIATPLMSPYFYDDFDHVRPYHPESLLLAFCGPAQSQMQYYGKAQLQVLDLWYRRSALRFCYCRGRHIPGFSRKLFALANLGLHLAYVASFRLLGRTDGWVGAFRCLQPSHGKNP